MASTSWPTARNYSSPAVASLVSMSGSNIKGAYEMKTAAVSDNMHHGSKVVLCGRNGGEVVRAKRKKESLVVQGLSRVIAKAAITCRRVMCVCLFLAVPWQLLGGACSSCNCSLPVVFKGFLSVWLQFIMIGMVSNNKTSYVVVRTHEY